jgi:hypothetical protein
MTIGEAMQRAAEPAADSSASGEAVERLESFRSDAGGSAERRNIIDVGRAAGHGEPALKRASKRLNSQVEALAPALRIELAKAYGPLAVERLDRPREVASGRVRWQE